METDPLHEVPITCLACGFEQTIPEFFIGRFIPCIKCGIDILTSENPDKAKDD